MCAYTAGKRSQDLSRAWNLTGINNSDCKTQTSQDNVAVITLIQSTITSDYTRRCSGIIHFKKSLDLVSETATTERRTGFGLRKIASQE